MRIQRGNLMVKRNQNSQQPVHRGDIVTVFPMDMRDRAGQVNTGIHGVVINDPREPGFAVEVVTLHGIIKPGRGGGRAYFSTDQYQLAHDEVAFPRAILDLQQRVRNGHFYRVTAPRVTLRAAHYAHAEVAREHPKKCGCKAKNACSTSRCKCLAAGVGCNDRCGCGSKCRNPN